MNSDDSRSSSFKGEVRWGMVFRSFGRNGLAENHPLPSPPLEGEGICVGEKVKKYD